MAHTVRIDVKVFMYTTTLVLLPLFLIFKSFKFIHLSSVPAADPRTYDWESINADLSSRAASSASFYMTQSEFNLYLKDYKVPINGLGRLVTVDDLVVLIKTSYECRSRIKALRATWMKWAQHIYMISDKDDPELGVMTFPTSENYTFGTGASIIRGHFFFHFVGFLWEAHREIFNKPYFLICDDDTWVNIPYVLHFLQPYNPHLKVIFTGLFKNNTMTNGCAIQHWLQTNCSKTGIAWGGGGPGALWTRHSMLLVAAMVRNGRCPWLEHEDVTLARCAVSGAHVVQVLSNGFDMRRSGHDESVPPLSMLTKHKICPDCSSQCRDAELAQLKQWSCSTAHRHRLNEMAIPECGTTILDPDSYHGV